MWVDDDIFSWDNIDCVCDIGWNICIYVVVISSGKILLINDIDIRLLYPFFFIIHQT